MPEEKEGLSLSHILIKNTLWNFIGQGCLFFVAFFATPFIIRCLGVNLYGIYAFISVIIGYFSFIQLGLGAASIKYISQYLAREDEEEVRRVFWVCLLSNIFLGLLGVILIFLSAHILVERFMKMPPELKHISVFVIKVGSLGFLITLIQSVVTGAIQAKKRFDILNRVSITFGILQIATAVIILKLGFSLREMVFSNIIISVICVYAYWLNVNRIFPFIRGPVWDTGILLRLFKFGGFVTVSSAVNPILLNIEKIMIASFSSVSSLTYYSVPFALMDRLTVIRSSFSAVLFPVFSSLDDPQAGNKNEVSRELHLRSTVYIIFLYSFFVLFFIFFAKPFLSVWLGEDFAVRSSKVLIVLALAGLINAGAAPSMNALQGMNKPYLPALFHLFETLLYIPLAFILIYKFSITGAALAWFLRAFLDMVLLHKASCRLFGEGVLFWYGGILRRIAPPLLLTSLLFYILVSLKVNLISFLGVASIVCIFVIYVYLVWRFGLDTFVRNKIRTFLNFYSAKFFLGRA